MNKTKLAIIGATVSATLALGGTAYNLNSQLKEVRGANQQLIEQGAKYQEELSKSLKEIETKNNQIQDLNKKIEDTNKKLEDANKKIEDFTKKVSYNPNDLSSPSSVSVVQLKKALKGTSLYGLADAFKTAEDETGVNALFLAGLVAHESGWGESARAQNSNNLTGYMVYSPMSRGGSFDSKESSIVTTARLIAESYLKESGDYYNGKSIWGVNTKYCLSGNSPDLDWSKSINSIANDLVSKINN